MACAPFFFHLNKGYTEINMVSGIWEIFTYRLFTLYKSDWIEVDGFDVMQYNTTWGGEDADLLDRYDISLSLSLTGSLSDRLSPLSCLGPSLSLSSKRMLASLMVVVSKLNYATLSF